MLRLIYSIIFCTLLLLVLNNLLHIGEMGSAIVSARANIATLASTFMPSATQISRLSGVLNPTYASFLCVFLLFTITRERIKELYAITSTIFFSALIVFLLIAYNHGQLRNVSFTLLGAALFDQLSIAFQNLILPCATFFSLKTIQVIIFDSIEKYKASKKLKKTMEVIPSSPETQS